MGATEARARRQHAGCPRGRSSRPPPAAAWGRSPPPAPRPRAPLGPPGLTPGAGGAGGARASGRRGAEPRPTAVGRVRRSRTTRAAGLEGKVNDPITQVPVVLRRHTHRLTACDLLRVHRRRGGSASEGRLPVCGSSIFKHAVLVLVLLACTSVNNGAPKNAASLLIERRAAAGEGQVPTDDPGRGVIEAHGRREAATG